MKGSNIILNEERYPEGSEGEPARDLFLKRIKAKKSKVGGP
jgi:hypothetical protein